MAENKLAIRAHTTHWVLVYPPQKRLWRGAHSKLHDMTMIWETNNKILISTVSFTKVVLSQGAVNQLFLGVFLMFLAVFHSKIWAQFHFGTFKPYK